MNQIDDKVHSTLSSLVNGSLRTYLQDAIITMRGDRYCIPVKAEYRSQVSGLIMTSLPQVLPFSSNRCLL